KGRNRSYLLAGDDLLNAESWLAASGGKEPKPTELHTNYIVASRTATTSRQRTTVGALIFGLAVAVSLAALSFILFQQSERNLSVAVAAQATSERRADEARSLALAAAAQQAVADGRPDLAVAFAVEANQIEPPSVLARRALYSAGDSPILQRFEGHADTVYSVAFSPDGQIALSGSYDHTLILWDVVTGEMI